MPRPCSEETKLGRLLNDRKIMAYILSAYIPISGRILTEYCAGRRPIRPEHLLRIAEFFDLDPEFIIEDDEIEDNEDKLDMASTRPRVILPPRTTLINPQTLASQHQAKIGRG